MIEKGLILFLLLLQDVILYLAETTSLQRMAVWMVCVKNGWLFGWFVLRTDGCLDGLCLGRMAVWMVCV